MYYENVKRLCDERGLSIYDLEKDADIGNGTIGRWKDSKNKPSVVTLQKIADFFGVSIEVLVRTEK